MPQTRSFVGCSLRLFSRASLVFLFAACCSKTDPQPSPVTDTSTQGCSKDADCKGNRVCVQKHCQDPSPQPTQTATQTATTAKPAPPPTQTVPPKPTTPANNTGTYEYTARLSAEDHRSSKCAALTDAASIIRQDRANYHRFNKRDREDTGDSIFSDETKRGQICALVNWSKDTEKTIIQRTPLVKVTGSEVRAGYTCEVTILAQGEALASKDIPPGGCSVGGIIYDSKGRVYGCEGGGNWCANAGPLKNGCPK